MKLSPSMLLRASGAKHHEVLYPKCYQDVQEILRQARDNRTPIRATGGTYPYTPMADDVIVDLRYIDRLVGMDIYQQTVVVESGMKISVLCRILESVSLSLDVFGRIPDLTVCDAIAVGTFGCNAMLLSSMAVAEVALASGKIVTWTWEKNPDEMRSLCCGLGMTAVLLSVTFRCVPLQRYTEISYLCSIREVLDHWLIQSKSSFCQQLLWFPFSELTVISHISPTEKYHIAKQPTSSYLLEKVGDLCSRAIRRLSILASRAVPLLGSFLSRVHFFSQWSVAKQRSDFMHSVPRFWAPAEASRAANWLIPINKLPQVLYSISQWAHEYPWPFVAPIFIQTFKSDKKLPKKPFLAPCLEEQSCAIWCDWFLPECNPDPIALADFEGIFHAAGGIRAWSGERLTSPLVLSEIFEKYPHWCRMKSKLDSNNYLNSSYVQGTVFSQSGLSESTLSLCSSIME